ncbi:MAG: hypothetical protein RJQ09_01930 [Cyclobacteriaceae bacterium]
MKIIFTVLLISVAFSSAAQNSDAIQSVVNQATALVGQGDNAGAIALLDSMNKITPNNFQILNSLGQAYARNQQQTEAIMAYEKALKIDPSVGRTHFFLGISKAQADDLDGAFESMLEARSKGYNTTNVNFTPVNQKMSEDDRYSRLFPSKKELADPFVEETKIIHEIHGETLGDQFGWIARNIGDVDKDGIDDFVTSAPTNDEGANNAGKIYVYSGETAKLLWSAVGTYPNGRLGMGVEYGGDINNDGIPDVVAAAPFANTAYAYSGDSGNILHTFEGDSTGGFGMHLSGVDDVNGDGFGDILIGEPYQRFNAPINGNSIDHAGKAHLYSGKDGRLLITWEGEEQADAFGTAVAGKKVGNSSWLIVGAPNAGPNNGGRVYVYNSISNDPKYVFEADSTASRFGGMFLSVVGDVNADGEADIYASDWGNNANAPGTGRAYVYSGADGSNLLTLTGETAGEGLGIGVSDCGDVNNDGYDDVAVGSWQYAGAAASGGRVSLYSGKDGGLIRTWTCKTMADTFGFDTTGLGDVDGDGTIDLLITSAYSAIKGFQSGRIFVISSK